MSELKLKLFLRNNQLIFTLFKYIGIGLILMIIALTLDLSSFKASLHIPNFFLTSYQLGNTILSTLSGGLLTIITFTFSTTMVVLTTYSNNYSPRIISNFLNNPKTMQVLGTFIGAFILNIGCLYFMSNADQSRMIVTPAFAIILTFYCIYQFVGFIFLISKSVQPQYLIESLSNDAQTKIKDGNKTFKQVKDDLASKEFLHTKKLCVLENGYLDEIDIEMINEILDDNQIWIEINRRLGDYVYTNDLIGYLYSLKPLSEKQLIALEKCVVTTSERASDKDYRFAIQKINEIGIKALSAGINDPITFENTAIKLAQRLATLAKFENDYQYQQTNYDQLQINLYTKILDFEDDLNNIIKPMVIYGKEHIDVVEIIYNALTNIMKNASSNNQQAILQMNNYLHNCTFKYQDNEVDQALVNKKYHQLKDFSH